MAKIINPQFRANMIARVAGKQAIDEVVSFNPAAKWLVVLLAHERIPFKVHNLGAGVKRITTNLEKCPCCGK